MSLYTIMKYVHVVLAIIAIGFNMTYAVWLGRAKRDPDHAAFTLRGIKTLDDRFATPAYVLLLVTGVGMVLESGLSFATFWIAAGLGLYVLIVIGGAFVYTPTLRRQIALAEAGEMATAEYGALARRGQTVGGVLLVIVLGIEFLMVTKPTV